MLVTNFKQNLAKLIFTFSIQRAFPRCITSPLTDTVYLIWPFDQKRLRNAAQGSLVGIEPTAVAKPARQFGHAMQILNHYHY
jgi:hypothetical protein